MAFLGIHILSSKQLAAIKAEAAQFATSEVGQAVAALKSTEIGAAVAADIAAISNKQMTGLEKFETVVRNTAPIITKYVVKGGFAAVQADVIDIARAVVQSVFNDTKSKTAPGLARAILSIVGLR